MKIKTFFMESWNYEGPWALHLPCRMEKSALAFSLWSNLLNVSSNQTPSHWSSSVTSGIFAQIRPFSWNSPSALLPLRTTELPYNSSLCSTPSFWSSISWMGPKSLPVFFFFLICSEFCHTLKWKGLGFTCLPNGDPPSHLPPHPLPPGPPRAPGPSACLMHPTWAGNLFHPW